MDTDRPHRLIGQILKDKNLIDESQIRQALAM